MRVWIDRTKLAARRLTANDIEAALNRENVQIPAGRIESQTREFSLNTSTGFEKAEDFRNLVIGRGADGYLVKLADVADVELAAENERTIARTNRISGVSVGIEAQSNANALEVAKRVRAEITALGKDLPAGTQLGINIDRAVFIEASLHEVLVALSISFTLVLLVIYAFLGNWRATVIPAVTIPISILAACAAMYAMGITLNVLTLLGIVLAIGLVVDDAIVVLENIYRRIEHGHPSLLAAIDGSKEIGFAVIATTLVLSAVFVPISFLGGRVGRLFSEFGFTLAASILFSCLVALTLTPMMTSQLFRGGAQRSRISDRVAELFTNLSAWYGRLLRRTLRHCWIVVICALAGLGGAMALVSTFQSESTPNDDRGAVRIVINGPEGASLQYMDGYARQLEDIVEAEMKQYGDIQRYNIRVPGGGGGGGVGEVNRAQSFIVLNDWGDRDRTADEIATSLRRKVSELPGVRSSVVTPTAFNWGGADPFKAVLGGPDYETLSAWSRKIMDAMAKEPGFLNVDTDYKERKPQIKVSIDRARAAELGVSLEGIGRTLETMMGSRIVTTFIKSGREYYVILQGQVEDRASPTDLDKLYVRSQRGDELIPLSSVVKLEELATSSSRNRFDRLRSVGVSATLAPGYSMGEAVDFMRRAVETELPASARLSFDGEASEYLKSSQSMYWTFGGALLVVFLVLAAQFESFKLPFVIMTTVPLAVVGAAVGMWVHGISINIYSQVAIVMLIGLAAKNGVLISMVLTLVVVPAVYTLVARNTRSPRYWTRLIEKMRATQDKLVPASPDAPGETARHDAH
jgi:multidrug efflux pump